MVCNRVVFGSGVGWLVILHTTLFMFDRFWVHVWSGLEV